MKSKSTESLKLHNKTHFSKIFQAADLVAMLGVEETDLDNYN